MYSIQGGNNLATMSHITAYKVLFIGEDIFKKCHFETSYGEEQKSFITLSWSLISLNFKANHFSLFRFDRKLRNQVPEVKLLPGFVVFPFARVITRFGRVDSMPVATLAFQAFSYAKCFLFGI